MFAFMPLYKFTIKVKPTPTSRPEIIIGLRLIESYNIDLVYKQANERCMKKYGHTLEDVDVIMVHKASLTYKKWVRRFQKPEPDDN